MLVILVVVVNLASLLILAILVILMNLVTLVKLAVLVTKYQDNEWHEPEGKMLIYTLTLIHYIVNERSGWAGLVGQKG